MARTNLKIADRGSRKHSHIIPIATRVFCCTGALLTALPPPAAAQDIRGLEVCTAEKQMERRTGCLQANVEFIQQAFTKLARETQDKIAAASEDLTKVQTELAASRAEVTVLKSSIEKLSSELAQMKTKVESSGKK